MKTKCLQMEKVIDLILPVAVLIVSAIGAMIYTGFLGGADNVVSAFAGCDAEKSLIFATMITVFVMLLFVSATQGRDIQRIYGQFCGGL